MESIEAEGDSIDAAIDAALKLLGTTRERVEIQILTNSSRGIFGIGGRKARVRAALRSPILADAMDAAGLADPADLEGTVDEAPAPRAPASQAPKARVPAPTATVPRASSPSPTDNAL